MVFKNMFKHYIQEESSDCGHACLQMVLGHFGYKFSLEKLRRLTGQIRGGVSLLHIRHTANQLGFETKELKIDWFNLFLYVPLPCILHWGGKHFVVLYKIKKKRNGQFVFYIADPAFGKIKLSKNDFLSKWDVENQDSGYVMVISPREALPLPKKEIKVSYNTPLLTQISSLKRIIFLSFFLLIVIGIMSFFSVKANQYLLDRGIMAKSSVAVIEFALLVFGISLFKALIEIVHQFFLQKSANSLSIDNIKRFLVQLTNINPFFFEQHKISELLQKVEDFTQIENFVTKIFPEFIFNVTVFIIYSVILCTINYSLLIWLLIYTFISILWIRFFSMKYKIINYQTYDVEVEVRNFMYEFIVGMQEIKLYGGIKSKIDTWERMQKRENNLTLKRLRLDNIEKGGFNFLSLINALIFTIIGALYVISNNLTIGQFWSIGFIVSQLLIPINFLSTFYSEYINTNITSKRINGIYSKQIESSVDVQIVDDKTFKDGIIFFDKIYFSYDKIVMPYVLENFSTSIKLGNTTAIVGESGSGKSTFAKLLLRLIEVESGNIYINNISLKDISSEGWRKHVGAVMQDGIIFSDTIINNIVLDETNVNMDMIVKSCEIACIDQFIRTLPNQYYTNLKQSGINLSFGQYQRLLIARAIYSKPNILIFDEATSALDAKNEYNVMKNLWTWFHDKTVIIVAHRLSTIINADEILFMENGIIAERGTHKDLMDKKGKYYNLFNYQVKN